MIEHNKNFYSLEELERTRDSLKGYLDNEEVYYFVGAIRYACNEIERLNKELENLKKLNNANYQSFIETNKTIIELENWLAKEYISGCYEELYRIGLQDSYDKLQELKGSDE